MQLRAELEESAKGLIVAVAEFGECVTSEVFSYAEFVGMVPEKLLKTARLATANPGAGFDALDSPAWLDQVCVPHVDEVNGLWVKFKSLHSRIMHIESLLQSVEDLSACDVQRDQRAVERVNAMIGKVSKEAYVPDFEVLPEGLVNYNDNVLDRSVYQATGTVFDTWCVLGPGELGLVLAGPNVGKTSALVDITCGYIENAPEGKVVFFSEEMSKNSIIGKSAARLSGTIKFSTKTLAETWKGYKAKLVVEAHHPMTSTVPFLAHRLRELVKPEEKLVAVVIDYMGVMSGSSRERYDILEEIVMGLRSTIAAKFKCPVWSAVQPQRGSSKEVRSARFSLDSNFELPVLKLSDVSQCWAIPQAADYLVSLNQTEAERQSNPASMRLYKAKVRLPGHSIPKQDIVQCGVSYETSQFL